VPNSPLSGQKCGNTAPKTVKISNFGHKFALEGRDSLLDNFYEILSVCTHLQVALKFLVWSLSRDKQPSYKDFPAVGAFSHKYSVAHSGETTDRIKKVREVQKMVRTSSITTPSMVGMDRAPAVDEKV